MELDKEKGEVGEEGGLRKRTSQESEEGGRGKGVIKGRQTKGERMMEPEIEKTVKWCK